jgi:hypothetical protein
MGKLAYDLDKGRTIYAHVPFFTLNYPQSLPAFLYGNIQYLFAENLFG